MSMKTGRIPGLALGLSFTLIMALAGCSGDSGMVAAVPASGTVTFDGKPLETGSIQSSRRSSTSPCGSPLGSAPSFT